MQTLEKAVEQGLSVPKYEKYKSKVVGRLEKGKNILDGVPIVSTSLKRTKLPNCDNSTLFLAPRDSVFRKFRNSQTDDSHFEEEEKESRLEMVLKSSLGLAVLAGVGYGFYRYFSKAD